MATVGIIGGGFSGSMLAIQLLRRCPRSIGLRLIERGPEAGPGIAYATADPGHLLNVRAGSISALPDQPNDFVDWLQRSGRNANPESFVPRCLYGLYMREMLSRELGRSENSGRLRIVRGEAVAMEDASRGSVIRLRDGRGVDSDLTALALGNLPPEPAIGSGAESLGGANYRSDPWAADALTGLEKNDAVLLIGTGLTMVDVVVSLLNAGHCGPIHALSRHGLLPLSHSEAGPYTPDSPDLSAHRGLDVRLRNLRLSAGRSIEEGGEWQPAFDALRPHTQKIWQDMSAAERARFLRHLRPWWDIHRHRMAPEIAKRIGHARQSRQLRIRAGRVAGIHRMDDGLRVEYRLRGAEACSLLEVRRAINCTGPNSDYERTENPLIRDLRQRGVIQADPHRLGIAVTEDLAVLGVDGTASTRLFALGPPTRGTFWEVTSVPDIRQQCVQLADRLAALF